MGNGIFSCKGCTEYCTDKTNIKINNNLYGNYNEIKLDKNKSQQRIITNIFIPNCKLEFSGDNTNINQNPSNPIINQINNQTNKIKIKTEKNWDYNIKEPDEPQNNFTQLFNEATKNDKNNSMISPSLTLAETMMNNQNNNKIIFNNYNIEMLNFINKVRSTPKLVIEDINNIIKSNLKVIDDKEYIISDNTNEIIKLNKYFEKVKEILNIQEPVDTLKLNKKLKITNYLETTELTDTIINDLLITKKREIINDYPYCFFYPIFIKDIKINTFLLLSNGKIKEKIFDNNFTDFYVSTFNEKNNRFFGIICFA